MPAPRPPRRASFQPRFTLGLLYVAGFFFVFCLLAAAPALFEVWRDVPAGPEQQAEAERVARETVQPRLLLALVLAALATAAGIGARVLPGYRRRS